LHGNTNPRCQSAPTPLYYLGEVKRILKRHLIAYY
jgi:hypothetical protein